VRAVAIELSSHALAQRRCFGVDCDVVVFTNLSHDHLDYHQTLERYLDAKLMLFDGRNRGPAPTRPWAVVNRDDARAPQVMDAALAGGLERRTFGEGAGADVRIRDLRPHRRGLGFELVEAGPGIAIDLPLLGRYNAWNAAAAFAAARALGIPAETAAAGLAAADPVPGRLERIDEGQPFDVVVDYAHTPDALTHAIAATREHAAGRLLLVFGCGGDRDRAKRPVMGRVAAERSDRAWITNDNPRSEEPSRIAAEIAAGDPAGRLAIELDRRTAIAAAFAAARPGDAVLVAGKGHEGTQTIGDRVLPFDDRVVARELLRAGAGR
jgi:UDP-N-acetylmuramoyl-L-alanyl-D-glutamate--2,6-diaminopimelate ligase